MLNTDPSNNNANNNDETIVTEETKAGPLGRMIDAMTKRPWATAAATAGTGVAGYFGYRFLKNRGDDAAAAAEMMADNGDLIVESIAAMSKLGFTGVVAALVG